MIKTKNGLALAAMVYTLVGIMACNAQAETDLIELSAKKDWVVLNELKDAPSEVVPVKAIRDTKIRDLDLVAVTRSIAHSESGNGKYAKHYNICNIMHWPNGQRELLKFDNYQAGFDHCYSLIKRKYQDYTIPSMAKKYTGNDSPLTWTSNALYWYNKQL